MRGITDETPLYLEYFVEIDDEEGMVTALLDECGGFWIAHAHHDPRDLHGHGYADAAEIVARLPNHLHPRGHTHH